MTEKTKKSLFYVQVKVEVMTSIVVDAETLDHAVTRANTLDIEDVVTIKGDPLDWSMEVVGAHK